MTDTENNGWETTDTPAAGKGTISNAQLLSIVERIERLNEDKKNVQEDVKQVLLEAKGNGFDPKIIRKVVALRDKTTAELQEEQALVDMYMTACEGGE